MALTYEEYASILNRGFFDVLSMKALGLKWVLWQLPGGGRSVSTAAI